MTKSPKYPIELAESDALGAERVRASIETPSDLYAGASFKLRHEVREQPENAETSFLRAHPELAPQRRSLRQMRRHLIRHGS